MTSSAITCIVPECPSAHPGRDIIEHLRREHTTFILSETCTHRWATERLSTPSTACSAPTARHQSYAEASRDTWPTDSAPCGAPTRVRSGTTSSAGPGGSRALSTISFPVHKCSTMDVERVGREAVLLVSNHSLIVMQHYRFPTISDAAVRQPTHRWRLALVLSGRRHPLKVQLSGRLAPAQRRGRREA
jgi:hypothetical protein